MQIERSASLRVNAPAHQIYSTAVLGEKAGVDLPCPQNSRAKSASASEVLAAGVPPSFAIRIVSSAHRWASLLAALSSGEVGP